MTAFMAFSLCGIYRAAKRKDNPMLKEQACVVRIIRASVRVDTPRSKHLDSETLIDSGR